MRGKEKQEKDLQLDQDLSWSWLWHVKLLNLGTDAPWFVIDGSLVLLWYIERLLGVCGSHVCGLCNGFVI